jgi:hypothetical protein
MVQPQVLTPPIRGHLHVILTLLRPKILPPFEHLRVHLFLLRLLTAHSEVIAGSAIAVAGSSGSHPEHSGNVCFQKNPFDLFHLHLTLRLPMATLPGSQTTIQVDLSQTLPEAPVGMASSGQRLHVAAALSAREPKQQTINTAF